MRRMRRQWLVLIAFAIVYAAAFLIGPEMRGSGGRVYPAGYSSSTAPTGSQSLSTLWSVQGVPFQPWSQPPVFLPASTTATLVLVEPQSSAYPPKAVTPLLEWVKSGHQLIVVSSTTNSILTSLHLRLQNQPPQTIRSLWLSGQKNAVLNGLQLTSSVTLTGQGLQAGTAFYKSSKTVLGAVLPVGQGQVTIWTVPAAWENDGVGVGNNFQLVWNMVGNHPILWDEFGHGEEWLGTWSFVFGNHRVWGGVLLLVAAALFVWQSLIRFGRPQATEDQGPRLGTEYQDAMAWHLRGKALQVYTATLVTAAVKRRFAKTDNPELKSAIAQWQNDCNQPLQSSRAYRSWLKQTTQLLQQLRQR